MPTNNTSGFDSVEDAIAEINKEFAGIMDRWSPNKGSFSTFVTANIAPKAEGIYDKYIGKRDVTTLDRPEAREVVAEEIDIDVTPTEVGRAKVYPASLEVITENVMYIILKSILVQLYGYRTEFIFLKLKTRE